MCILLWTLPANNHPRFKFALASNRDEVMARPTARAQLWETDEDMGPAEHGVISGLDLSTAAKASAPLSPGGSGGTLEHPLPGTWLGMTTKGDLIALTNYRETKNYKDSGNKTSRGRLCADYLVTALARYNTLDSNSDHSKDTKQQQLQPDLEPTSLAAEWLEKKSKTYDTQYEGFNLLIVEQLGEVQYMAGNREGSRIHSTRVASSTTSDSTSSSKPTTGGASSSSIETTSCSEIQGTTAGVSNSTFARPWTKVDIGSNALRVVLERNLIIFGETHNGTTTGAPCNLAEVGWMIKELLTMLLVNSAPFSKEESIDTWSTAIGFRKRVFIPRVGLRMGTDRLMDYGTRSSTVVLYGRGNDEVYFVEKEWYNPSTAEMYAPDSTEGLVIWTGIAGQAPKLWKKLDEEEVEKLMSAGRGV